MNEGVYPKCFKYVIVDGEIVKVDIRASVGQMIKLTDQETGKTFRRKIRWINAMSWEQAKKMIAAKEK